MGKSEVSLGEVCRIASSLVDPRESPYRDMLHVGGANIESHTGALLNLRSASEEKLKSGKYCFDESMVLYSKIRPYLVKVAYPQFSGICSADIYPLTADAERLNKEYLFYLLQTSDFTQYAIGGSNRAGMPKVNRSHLFGYKFLLPSLDEQGRTVSRIKSNLSRLLEIATYRAQADEEIDSLVESALHDTWESCEVSTAERWRLEDLGDIITGNTPSRKRPEFFGGAQAWVTPGDFDGRVVSHGREALSPQGISEGRARLIEAGGVLVVCIGATIGKVAVAGQRLGINQQINAVAFDESKVTSDYGYWACRALNSDIIDNASKNTLPILNKGRFGQLQIPVPTLTVQKRIATRLNMLDLAVEEMRRDSESVRQDCGVLRASILCKAFEGSCNQRG